MKSIDPKTKNSADPSQPNFLYSRVKKKKKKNNKDPRAQNISSFPDKICTLHPCTRNAVPSLPSTFIIYIYLYIFALVSLSSSTSVVNPFQPACPRSFLLPVQQLRRLKARGMKFIRGRHKSNRIPIRNAIAIPGEQ